MIIREKEKMAEGSTKTGKKGASNNNVNAYLNSSLLNSD